MFLLTFLMSRQTAHACSVCFAATDANRVAFINTTAFMSFFPLAIIFGGVWVLYKRSMAIEEAVDESG